MSSGIALAQKKPSHTSNKCCSGCKKGQSVIDKKATAKYLARGIVSQLANIKDSPLIKSYVRSLYCAGTITVEGGKPRSTYCKNRFCLVCSRIYTARYINAYQPIIESQMATPFFVTLTRPNVTAEGLIQEVIDMFKLWQKLYNRYRRHAHRRGVKFKAVLRMECTFNLHTGFNPHFHILLEEDYAYRLVADWLTENKKLGIDCSPGAQDVRQFSKDNLLEMFKYSTKMLSETTEKGQKEGKKVYIEALDIIYRAFSGRKLVRVYGMKAPKAPEEENPEEFTQEDLHTVASIDKSDGVYTWDTFTWVDKETGEILSNFVPGNREKEFIKRIIPPRSNQLWPKPQKDPHYG